MHLDPTWIVVADGRAVRFFWRKHWKKPLKEFSNLSDSADVLDKRVAGPAVSPIAESQTLAKWSRQSRDDEAKSFLRRVATSIDRTLTDHPAAGLILCAPAKELGLLRDYLSARSRAKLSCEVAKDLVGAKVAHVEAVVHHLKV